MTKDFNINSDRIYKSESNFALIFYMITFIVVIGVTSILVNIFEFYLIALGILILTFSFIHFDKVAINSNFVIIEKRYFLALIRQKYILHFIDIKEIEIIKLSTSKLDAKLYSNPYQPNPYFIEIIVGYKYYHSNSEIRVTAKNFDLKLYIRLTEKDISEIHNTLLMNSINSKTKVKEVVIKS